MYKQIIIVRKDLKMSAGKLAAQVSHASIAFLTHMLQNHVVGKVFEGAGFSGSFMKPLNVYRVETFDIDADLYEQWINGSFTKCILEAKSYNHLMKAKQLADDMGLIENKDYFCIYDECRTELTPEYIDSNGKGRCLTCIGFLPMSESVIDKIGKKYQLYKG